MFMNMITKFPSKGRREKFMHRVESDMFIFLQEKLSKKCFQHKFYPSVFIKVSNIKFYENSSSGCRVVTCEVTDGGRTKKHDTAYMRFSRLYESLKCCSRELLIALI